jgi:Ca2+-binding RTX toxin-like protein
MQDFTPYTKSTISGADIISDLMIRWNTMQGEAPPLSQNINIFDYLTHNWTNSGTPAGEIPTPPNLTTLDGSTYSVTLRSEQGALLSAVNDANRDTYVFNLSRNGDRSKGESTDQLSYTVTSKNTTSTAKNGLTVTENYSYGGKVNWSKVFNSVQNQPSQNVLVNGNKTETSKIVYTKATPSATTFTGVEDSQVAETVNLSIPGFKVSGVFNTRSTGKNTDLGAPLGYESAFDKSFTSSLKVTNYAFEDTPDSLRPSDTFKFSFSNSSLEIADKDTSDLIGPTGTFTIQKGRVETVEAIFETPRATIKLDDRLLEAVRNVNLLPDNLSTLRSSFAIGIEPLLTAADNVITIKPGTEAAIFGGDGRDNIRGNTGSDTLDGGAGADTLAGGLGGDTYILIHGGHTDKHSGSDTIIDGDVTVPSTVAGGAAASVDTIYIESTLRGGFDLYRPNKDTLIAMDYSSNSTVTIQEARGRIEQLTFFDPETGFSNSYNLTGSDLKSTEGNDWMPGTRLKDTMAGGSGDDVIQADAGDDVLRGEAGNDVLIGGTGPDTMEGGEGNDLYLMVPGWGAETIIDTEGFSDTVRFFGTEWQLERIPATITTGTGKDIKTTSAGFDNLVITDPSNSKIKSTVSNVTTIEFVHFVDFNNKEYDKSTKTWSYAPKEKYYHEFRLNTWGDGSSQDSEYILGTPGSDWYRGGRGMDVIDTGAGDDTIFTHPKDTDFEGRQANFASAGAGNDVMILSDNLDVMVDAGPGDDVVDAFYLTRSTPRPSGQAALRAAEEGTWKDADIRGGAGNDAIAIDYLWLFPPTATLSASPFDAKGSYNKANRELNLPWFAEEFEFIVPTILSNDLPNLTPIQKTGLEGTAKGYDILRVIIPKAAPTVAAGTGPETQGESNNAQVLNMTTGYLDEIVIDPEVNSWEPYDETSEIQTITLNLTPSANPVNQPTGTLRIDANWLTQTLIINPPGALRPLSIQSGKGNDTLSGSAVNDFIKGGDGNDSLDGGMGSDNLSGNAGADDLYGGMGGADTLSGGEGPDNFIIDAAAKDIVVDFNKAEGDRISLVGTNIDDLTTNGVFVTGTGTAPPVTTALPANTRLIYNQTNGELRYDPDGGAITNADVIGVFTNKPILAASDFGLPQGLPL